MSNSLIQRPNTALESLRAVVVPKGASPDTAIQLIIRISEQNLSIRDMSAFLEFIDHIHGRLTSEGFRSYARREYGHLKISRLRSGSFELVLETVLRHLKQSEILLIIWLALKYLPHVIQAAATSYNEYEQGRLARENRKRLKQEMKDEKKLRNLPPNRLRELATLIDILYSKEADNLPRAKRFARKNLLDVEIQVSKKEQPQRDKENS